MKHGGHCKDMYHWYIQLTFPRGQAIEFKFVNKTEDGNILWEANENRSFTSEGGDSVMDWGTFRYP